MSKQITLEQRDYEQIIDFVKKFKEKNQRLNEISEKLKSLEEEYIKVEHELTEIRKEEEEFDKELTSKYGSGKLNMETLYYELDQ